MNAFQVSKRHEQHAALVESDHLGQHRVLVGETGHSAELTQRHVIHAGGLDHEPYDPGGAAVDAEPRHLPNLLDHGLNHLVASSW